MTDKEKIRKEVERLKGWNNNVRNSTRHMTLQEEDFNRGKHSSYLEILNFIDSLQEEPVSEEFEKALAEEWKGYNERGAAMVDALEDNTQELAFAKGFYRGSKWQKAKDEHLIWQISSANYEKGKQEGKELIMENATEAIVAVDAGGYPYVDKHIELYDYDKDVPLANAGEKVKVIVIKEN